MIRNTIAVTVIVLMLLAGGVYLYVTNNGDHNAAPSETTEEEGAAHGESAEIAKAEAEAAGIKTAIVTGAAVHETVTLTGRITLNQNTTAQVKARFAGIVRQVRKGLGETVKAGDVLAMVESNDSLQTYPVGSPIDGVVLARNTNIGDVAGEDPLFTVADVSEVWAEFHVFPRDIDRIQNGQMVRVTSFEGEHTEQAPIRVVSPIAEASSQTIVARVTLPNEKGLWHAGMTVRGDVTVSEKEVPLAVRTSAIQRVDGKTVVFVESGDRYAMRQVETGMSDPQWTEVIDGLQKGESYVSENSFLIKAEIGKAGAEHED